MKNSKYLYEHVTSSVLFEDMNFSDEAPRPGEPLPRFRVPNTEGDLVGPEDFLGSRPVLLVTGSFTCPMTLSSNPGLKRLYDRFSSQVQFLMLHVREAHPGEHHDQSQTAEQKLEYARRLKSRDELPWPVLVDDPEGTVHRMLDTKPNAAYLADQSGTIVFRSLWVGDKEALAQALDSVARGERPQQQESHRRFGPMAEGLGVMREVLHQSGPRAERDLWRAAPPMAMVAWLASLFRPLDPKSRAMAAMATIGVVVVAIVAIGTALIA